MKTTQELAEIAKKVQAVLVDARLSYAEMAMVLGFAYAILISTAIKYKEEVDQ